MTGHDCRPEMIGRWGDEIEFTVEKDRIIAYARATNDPISHHLDGRYAPPVFAVVPPFSCLAETTMSAVPDELMLRILHGEQDFRFVRPLIPGETVFSRTKIVGIHGKNSGVVVTTLAETRDATGRLVNEQFFTGFFRGGVWPHVAGEMGPRHNFDEVLRARPADFLVEQKFDEDQTFRYAEPAGDPMPVHLDDEFAKSMGLPGIIVHGLCTQAFVSHALLTQVARDDPARLKRLAVRFAKPARPGQLMTTSIWHSDSCAECDTYSFESVSDAGEQLIKDGLAEIAR